MVSGTGRNRSVAALAPPLKPAMFWPCCRVQRPRLRPAGPRARPFRCVYRPRRRRSGGNRGGACGGSARGWTSLGAISAHLRSAGRYAQAAVVRCTVIRSLAARPEGSRRSTIARSPSSPSSRARRRTRPPAWSCMSGWEHRHGGRAALHRSCRGNRGACLRPGLCIGQSRHLHDWCAMTTPLLFPMPGNEGLAAKLAACPGRRPRPPRHPALSRRRELSAVRRRPEGAPARTAVHA